MPEALPPPSPKDGEGVLAPKGTRLSFTQPAAAHAQKKPELHETVATDTGASCLASQVLGLEVCHDEARKLLLHAELVKLEALR